MGQSRTAVGGTLGIGRGRGAANPRSRSDRDFANHARASSRADQASGRSHNPTHPRQRLCRAETKAAAERARLLIEQAEALGEPPEDPLLLFSVLAAFWAANYVAFNGDVVCESRGAVAGARGEAKGDGPAHDRASPYGQSLLFTGDIAEGRAHLDQAIALYDPAEHRPLATRFGQDFGVATLSFRSLALWLLGYPEAALRDARPRARERARDRSSRHVDVRFAHARDTTYPLRQSRSGEPRKPKNLSLWPKKKVPHFGRHSER